MKKRNFRKSLTAQLIALAMLFPRYSLTLYTRVMMMYIKNTLWKKESFIARFCRGVIPIRQ
jgi:hypothetical protein